MGITPELRRRTNFSNIERGCQWFALSAAFRPGIRPRQPARLRRSTGAVLVEPGQATRIHHRRTRLQTRDLGHPRRQREDRRNRLRTQPRNHAGAGIGDQALHLRGRPDCRGRGYDRGDRRLPARHSPGGHVPRRSHPCRGRRPDLRRADEKRQDRFPRQGPHLRQQRPGRLGADRHRSARRDQRARQTGEGSGHYASRWRRVDRRPSLRPDCAAPGAVRTRFRP